MSHFEGLKDRLKKKKEEQKKTATTPSTSSAAPHDEVLYAKAIEHVKASRSTVPEAPAKREREEEEIALMSVEEEAPRVVTLLTKEQFEERKATTLDVLRRLLHHAKDNFRGLHSGVKDEEDDEFFLPEQVIHFLTDSFIEDRELLTADTTRRMEKEWELVSDLSRAPRSPPADPRADRIPRGHPHRGRLKEARQFMAALWFLTLSQWIASIEEVLEQTQWDHSVYLFLQHRLPEELKYTVGRQISLRAEKWKERLSNRWRTLELLSYFYYDYRHLKQTTDPSVEVDTVVPNVLAGQLHRLLVVTYQVEHRYAEARQSYIDITHGTSDWKLGLFTGGEVHMRRSLERVDRNRVTHLLHNEHAVALLHALIEVIRFAETEMSSPDRLNFFAPSTKKPSTLKGKEEDETIQ